MISNIDEYNKACAEALESLKEVLKKGVTNNDLMYAIDITHKIVTDCFVMNMRYSEGEKRNKEDEIADKYVKVSDIEEYCDTNSACMQGKGQSVTQAALRRVKEYAIENAVYVQPVKRGNMTEKQLYALTTWLKDNIFRNTNIMYDDAIWNQGMSLKGDIIDCNDCNDCNKCKDCGERFDLIDIIATLHNLLYESITGDRYDYMFHWCNKIGSDCKDNVFDALISNTEREIK